MFFMCTIFTNTKTDSKWLKSPKKAAHVSFPFNNAHIPRKFVLINIPKC